MLLSDLKNGESALIVRVAGHGAFRKRIMEMGFIRNKLVTSVQNSPLNDPVKYRVMDYEVSLRRSEAEMVEVMYRDEADARMTLEQQAGCYGACEGCAACGCLRKRQPVYKKNEINVALVGNPNSGKTSLFNLLSGGHEHIGNYAGVTIEAKTGHFDYKGYRINLTDLPGTYSISAYSPEEMYVRNHLYQEMPDVVLNVVVASNLERNLYLTTELIDMDMPTVVALNMYDELLAAEAHVDYENLGEMMGVPMLPTVAKNGEGVDKLLDMVIALFEGKCSCARHIHIKYGNVLEPFIDQLGQSIAGDDEVARRFPARYWAVKLLERDGEVEKLLNNRAGWKEWERMVTEASAQIKKLMKEDVESVVSDYKYGFISGALRDTYVKGRPEANRKTALIDRVVAGKWTGFPLFILLMWIMFTVTFELGAYPQDWIDAGFGAMGDWLSGLLPDGMIKDLLVDGVVAGVGAVAVFLPNIILLYLFISFMEDSGYMARAAFIMDRLMHKMGLHGKSFIPLLMGFGCNVPSIMAARTIESKSSRLITILVNPFMSCSARLPVYILLAGTFFPNYAGTVIVALYLLGGLVAVVTARLLRRATFKKDEAPFVMELPPFRLPTLRSIFKHTWNKSEQYIKKIGTVILLASVVVWALGYFPRQDADAASFDEEKQYEQSYLGRIGRFIEPVMQPLGLDWRAGVAVLSGVAAKEVVVSTMGVLYGGDEDSLPAALEASGDYTPGAALALMVFVLLYCPCFAALAAVAGETGSRKWVLFPIFYNTAVAWLLAFAAYHLWL